MLSDMKSEQIAVRLPVELLSALDDMVRHGTYANRAAAVRAGVRLLAEAERRRLVDESLIAGYTRVPPTPAGEAAAFASLRQAIVEEPW